MFYYYLTRVFNLSVNLNDQLLLGYQLFLGCCIT